MVVKKDNTREMYDRAKIEAGILHSCHKRPVSQGQISALIDDVEHNLFNREEREISTAVIGELVLSLIHIWFFLDRYFYLLLFRNF